MATNFPNSPSNGDTHTFGGVTYTYSSSMGAWTGPSTTAGGGASVTVSENAPSGASEGDLWFDPSVLKTFVYYNDGTANQWVQSNPTGSGGSGGGGASVTASDTAPTSPSAGDLWFKSDTGALYVYYTDADSSQWVGVSGPAGADGAAGAAGSSASVSYANLAAFPSSPTEGDIAYAQDTNALYVYDGSEWDRISSGSDESPRVTTEPASSHTLNQDGTTSTVTMVAEDPEGFDIEYGIRYNTSGNTLPSQLASATTINQSTGVFTFTPTTTESNAGSFTARLTASDGNRVTTRSIPFNLAFYPAVPNLTARYDVGDSNSLTGTGTSWPDTSGNNATALTVGYNSGDGTVETGTWTGITVLKGGSVAGQHTTVTIPTSLLSSTSTIALIVALGNNDGSIAILNGSSGYHGYVHPTATGYGFNYQYYGNAYIDGGTASTGSLANNLLLGDTTKQQQLHSLIFDGVDWTTRGDITFNNYSSNSWRTLDFELRAIAIWDRALSATEREELHNYYLNNVASGKMAAWAG